MSNFRIQNGLPRGGIGYGSIGTGLASLIVAAVVEPGLALVICVPAAILSTWLAIGLRYDYESGEAVDEIVTDNEQSWLGWASGDSPTTSLWRISTMVILCSLVSLGIAIARLLQ